MEILNRVKRLMQFLFNSSYSASDTNILLHKLARFFYLIPRIHIAAIVLLVFCILLRPNSIQAANEGISTEFEVEYVSKTNVPLVELAAGAAGDGRILYFVKNGDRRTLRLLVHLYRKPDMLASIAEVYEIPQNLNPYADTIPMRSSDAAIIMETVDGWWVKDNFVNYNLNVETRSSFQSMWGPVWFNLLAQNRPAAEIKIRDTDHDGVPDWDLRNMIPELPGRADYRMNYTERKCLAQNTIDRSVSPEWPYIASSGSFEQQTGHFRPPIVVDWESGKVKFFSEVVTARHQNCSYAIYSISGLEEGKLNHPNFETPFAFYDLSGARTGYPNLILRTEHYPAGDPWAGGKKTAYTGIRYSWRNKPGDWFWDYKIDVLGLNDYDFVTRIAGGLATIDAPSYDVFPSWVTNHNWPVVTFVDSEGTGYQSGEGIYEWSAMKTGLEYITGNSNVTSTAGFSDITPGFRGEYRVQHIGMPQLYFSPIDNRLHLKWAEHGIWRLAGAQIIRVDNLDGDAYIDVWSREVNAETTKEKVRPEQGNGLTEMNSAAAESVIIETLYALDGYLIHTNGTNITLLASTYQPALFETIPPTDHDSWEKQRAQLVSYETQRRDPTDLRSWLDAFQGQRSVIKGASLSNLRRTGDGWRFNLSLKSNFGISGPDILGLGDHPADNYLVENDGISFSITPLIPAKLSISITQPNMESDAASIWITINNNGLADAPGLMLVTEIVGSESGVITLSRKPVDAISKQSVRMLVNIPRVMQKGMALRLRLEDATEQTLAEATLPDNGSQKPISLEQHILYLSTVNGRWSGWLLVLALLAAFPLVGLWRRRPAAAKENRE